MGSPFLKTDVTSAFLGISGKVPLLTQLLKISVLFSKQTEIDSLSTETWILSETVALFPGSSLIKFKTSFLEAV